MPCNWNSVLAYQTFKTVQIRDWRLGLLHYTLELGIFIYILYEIITKTLYIAKSPVAAGSIRTQLKLDTASLPQVAPDFCKEVTGGCLFWTERQAQFPEATDGSIFITTRVSFTTYAAPSPACASSSFPLLSTVPDFSCSGTANPGPKTTYYIPYVENMTLLIDHTARSAIDSPVALSSSNMVGKLYNTNGELVTDFDEAYHSSNKAKGINGDILKIGDILKAAGADLSKLSGAPGAGPNENQRSAGVVISFLINYQNRESGFTNINNLALKYKYYPTAVGNTEYKSQQTIYNSNGTMTLLDRHGIYITFAQSGQIGQFSFIAFLTNLVASIALLKVASLVVDFLMTMVLPEKALYKDAKIQACKITEEIGNTKFRESLENPSEYATHSSGGYAVARQ
ncbi:cytochrome c oxidase subunit 1 [Phlyctochytrium planicorne]|nr:cytochrome c oxidase subunit 1 [Phlyctochytrium planicorne]